MPATNSPETHTKAFGLEQFDEHVYMSRLDQTEDSDFLRRMTFNCFLADDFYLSRQIASCTDISSLKKLKAQIKPEAKIYDYTLPKTRFVLGKRYDSEQQCNVPITLFTPYGFLINLSNDYKFDDDHKKRFCKETIEKLKSTYERIDSILYFTFIRTLVTKMHNLDILSNNCFLVLEAVHVLDKTEKNKKITFIQRTFAEINDSNKLERVLQNALEELYDYKGSQVVLTCTLLPFSPELYGLKEEKDKVLDFIDNPVEVRTTEKMRLITNIDDITIPIDYLNKTLNRPTMILLSMLSSIVSFLHVFLFYTFIPLPFVHIGIIFSLFMLSTHLSNIFLVELSRVYIISSKKGDKSATYEELNNERIKIPNFIYKSLFKLSKLAYTPYIFFWYIILFKASYKVCSIFI